MTGIGISVASENCLNFRRVAAGLLGRSRWGVAGADWQEEDPFTKQEDPIEDRILLTESADKERH